MSPLASPTSVLALLCVLAAVCLLNYGQVASKTVSNDRFSSDDETLDMFPSAPECGADEYAAFGVLPTCEPTCRNKRPTCEKIYVILDYVPCFCKKGLVRDTDSKRCVRESECKV